jgi:hypothetical protein
MSWWRKWGSNFAAVLSRFKLLILKHSRYSVYSRQVCGVYRTGYREAPDFWKAKGFWVAAFWKGEQKYKNIIVRTEVNLQCEIRMKLYV